jgi:hypothetical protein
MPTPSAKYKELEEEYRHALSSHLVGLGPRWDVTSRTSSDVSFLQVSPKDTALPTQGWKIHVSASALEAAKFCHAVLPCLRSRGLAHKIVADIGSIIRVNSGRVGETQTGKILTVYPRDAEVASIAAELDQRWSTTRGPAVPSDLVVRAGGAVFLRYGAFDGGVLDDRLGRSLPALRAPDGTLVEDLRSADGRQPNWAAPPLPGLAPAVPELTGSFELTGESYLPLLLMHQSPRGKVFLGLAQSDASEVVVKTGRRGVGGGLSSSAAEERLKAEYDVLRALKGASGVAPQPVDYAEGSDFAVLITEHIEGQAFADLNFERQILSLLELTIAVSNLHALGFAHRDVKLANAIATETGVRLVDFELAVPFGIEGFTPAGTRGYFPAETEPCSSGAVDVYAIGVCVAHVFLHLDPASLPTGGGRLVGLLQHFGHYHVARIVRTLVDSRPSKRPSAAAAVEILEGLNRQPAVDQRSETRVGARRRTVRPAWCLRVANEAGLATRHFKQKMNCGCMWGSQHEATASPEGVNSGAAGVILGLASIDQACGSSRFSEDIKSGAEWLASRSPNAVAHGFFTGNAGASVALAVAGKRFGRSEWIEAAWIRLAAAVCVEGECDLFSGTAGVLWAACLIGSILGEEKASAFAARCGELLVRLAEVREGLFVWPSIGAAPMTGAAHGSAGIAMALAIWGRMARRPVAVDLALETFERLYRNGRIGEGATLRRSVDEASSGAPVLSWCHGIAGYLWCMMLAFGDDRRLAPAIDWSLERCAGTKALASPVYCHGTAGELELWRLIAEHPRHAMCARSRADRAAGVLRLVSFRERECCVWGSEDPEVIKPDLWVGFLGPATALALYARKCSHALLSPSWLRSCAFGK